MRTFYGVEEHAIELTCGCDDIGVTFDPDTCTAIATVVNELVANAVEHAFGGAGGRIDIRLQRGAEGPVLTVFDNGSGLPSARPESIGLAVARDLLSGVGGSMSVTANGGTTWTINLPPR
jgi:two-component sensor histidine kinase